MAFIHTTLLTVTPEVSVTVSVQSGGAHECYEDTITEFAALFKVSRIAAIDMLAEAEQSGRLIESTIDEAGYSVDLTNLL